MLYISGCWGNTLTRGSSTQSVMPWLGAFDLRGSVVSSAALFAHAALSQVVLRHAFGCVTDAERDGAAENGDVSAPPDDLAFICGGGAVVNAASHERMRPVRDEGALLVRVRTVLRTETLPCLPAVLVPSTSSGALVVTREALAGWCRLERARAGLAPAPALEDEAELAPPSLLSLLSVPKQAPLSVAAPARASMSSRRV